MTRFWHCAGLAQPQKSGSGVLVSAARRRQTNRAATGFGADLEHFAPFRWFSPALAVPYQARPLISLKKSGRGERIRTSGLYVPNVALYLAKLHPASTKPSGLPFQQFRG